MDAHLPSASTQPSVSHDQRTLRTFTSRATRGLLSFATNSASFVMSSGTVASASIWRPLRASMTALTAAPLRRHLDASAHTVGMAQSTKSRGGLARWPICSTSRRSPWLSDPQPQSGRWLAQGADRQRPRHGRTGRHHPRRRRYHDRGRGRRRFQSGARRAVLRAQAGRGNLVRGQGCQRPLSGRFRLGGHAAPRQRRRRGGQGSRRC